MKGHQRLVTAISLTLFVACGPIQNYRRTAERDLEAAVKSLRAIGQDRPESVFERLRTDLGCVETTDEVGATRRADCLGKDDRPVSVIALYREQGASNYVLDVEAPDSGNRATSIAREHLGQPQGVTSDGGPAWTIPPGILSAPPNHLRLEHPASKDIHDVMEVGSELRLPSADDAITRINAVLERHGGTRGAQATPAKLVALSLERGHLSEEACIGDLLIEGHQICLGRALASQNPPTLAQIHATCTARRDQSCDVTKFTALLGEVIGDGIRSKIDGVLKRQGDTAFASAREGNFAIVSTRQDFDEEPFEFRHLIVARRLVFSPNMEVALQRDATRPPVTANFDKDLVRELMREEEKRRPTSR